MKPSAIRRLSQSFLISALVLISVAIKPLSAQGISGDFDLVSIHVQYIDELRDTTGTAALGHASGKYAIELSWPSSAAAAAGLGFTFPIAEFDVGDTVAAPSTPEFLLTPEGLAAFTIDLSVTLGGGSMLIPKGGTGTSNYPTTDIIACSTFAVIKSVTDNATIAFSTNFVIDSTNSSITYGLGIDQSSVFAWFKPADPTAAPTTWPENWGTITAYYSDNTFATLNQIAVTWRAIDGADADLGVDSNGKLNRMLGVAVLDGSTAMVSHTETIFGLPAGTFNQGTFPTLVPTGFVETTGLPADSVSSVNHAYLFDPVGDDGIPLSGDEPFQFTGYYFTYKLLAGFQSVEKAFDSLFVSQTLRIIAAGVTDTATAKVAAFDTTLDVGLQWAYAGYGVDAATAAAVAGPVATIVKDSLVLWLTAAAVDGDDPEEVFGDAGRFGLVTAVGAMKLANAAFTIDDSDHDVDLTSATTTALGGRLLFEVDHNCIPVIETQIVNAIFYESSYVSVEETEAVVPTVFALHDNYPNPFNPSTIFSFDLPNSAQTTVTIWNLLGQEIRTLYSGVLPAGSHTVTFDGHDNVGNSVPSGVYFYRVATPNNASTRKMLLLK